MTTLRLLLLLAGVLFVIGVWWWSRRQQRRRGAIPTRRVERLPAEPGIEAPRGSRVEDEDEEIDFAGTLADLSGLMREGRAERSTTAASEETRELSRRRTARRQPSRQMDSDQADTRQLDMGFEQEPLAGPLLPERVIAIFVRASPGTVFSGPALAAAFAAVDMRFGDMSIYHHHGVGNLLSAIPLFSAANMFEPGAFDPVTMDEFQTGGIALFMQLPGHKAASLVFELMLNTAQRLAQALHGEVLDDTRQPLNSQSIDQLRALVKQYDLA